MAALPMIAPAGMVPDWLPRHSPADCCQATYLRLSSDLGRITGDRLLL